MLKSILIIITLLVVRVCVGQSYTISDSNFSTFLQNTYPSIMTGNDLNIAGAQGIVGTLDCANNGIVDLDGIQHFTGISALVCTQNQLTSMDLSENNQLTQLLCGNNELTAITGLNQLVNLVYFYANGNQLTDVDGILGASNLYGIQLQGNAITSLPSLINFPELRQLNINNNPLGGVTLDLSNSVHVSNLSCSNTGIVGITGMDMLNNLYYLFAANNDITSLEGLETCSSMLQLDVMNNALSDFPDMSAFPDLQHLNTSENPLSLGVVDVSQSPAITGWKCVGNGITEIIGLNNLTNLHYFDIRDNELTHLDGLSAAIELREFAASDNQLIRLPELGSASSLFTVSVAGNRLDYSDAAEIMIIDQMPSMLYFTYVPQATFGEELDLSVCEGESFTLDVDDQFEDFQWYKDGVAVDGDSESLTVDNYTLADAGVYTYETYSANYTYPGEMKFAPGLSTFTSAGMTVNSSLSDECESGCEEGKVQICHIPPGNPENPQTICVSPNAVDAHLAHGDHLGSCGADSGNDDDDDDESGSGSGGMTSALTTVSVSPNPYSAPASVAFKVPMACHVNIRVMNSEGVLVMTLVDAEYPAGEHVVSLFTGVTGLKTIIMRTDGCMGTIHSTKVSEVSN